jgi:hypothetical protein
MPPLDLTQRRSAAFMTLSEVTEGEQLMKAMWMLEERDKTADKISFIGFFGNTAKALGIKSHVINLLYPKLNRNLGLPKQQLIDDPLPKMLEFRGMRQTGIKKTAVTVENKQAGDAGNKTKGTPEMSVFVVLITKITAEAGYPEAESYGIFKEVFKEEMAEARVYDFNRKQVTAWVDTLDLKVFKRNIDKPELFLMVHSLYVALCEALGPVEADFILDNAVSFSAKIPAAKLFSPTNFL